MSTQYVANRANTQATTALAPAVLRDVTDGKNLAAILPTLSSATDKADLLQSQYDINRQYNNAARQYNTGITTSGNDLAQALRQSRQSGYNQRQVGLSQAGESNLGWSPAVAGAAVYAAAQQQANAQAQAQQDYAVAQGSLRSMYDQAQAAAAEQSALLTQDAARRKAYADSIRTYGG